MTNKARSSWLVLMILAIVLNLGFNALAQTGEGEIENWMGATVLCETADNWLLEVDVSAQVSMVYIFPDSMGAWVWFVGEAKSRRFWIAKANEYVALRVEVGGQGGYNADTVMLGAAAACQDTAGESGEAGAMNECLGFSLDELVARTNYLPLGDGFEVDGRAYLFHENLSFLVPAEITWVWDLYVDGRHLLRFEQSKGMSCHVTEVYPQ